MAKDFKSKVRSQKLMEFIFKILKKKSFEPRILISSQPTNQIKMWNKKFFDMQGFKKFTSYASFLRKLLKYEDLNQERKRKRDPT